MPAPILPRRTVGAATARTVRRLAVSAGAGAGQQASDVLLQGAGSELIGQTFDSTLITNITDYGGVMANLRVGLAALYIGAPVELTGAVMYLWTAGAYSGTTYNGMGLYQLAEDGISLDRIAQTTNDGLIWKSSGLIQKPFTQPVTVASGVYWHAFLWQQTSVTVTPNRAGLTPAAGLTNILMSSTPILRATSLAAQTGLPSNIAFSATTAATQFHWAAVY